MKLKYILPISLFIGTAIGFSSCSLDIDPLGFYSDVTEGSKEEEEQPIFKDKAAAEAHLKTLYNLLRDRQEHWYLDYLLLGDAHSDNAYGGTTGAEVIPFENNSVEGSNPVMSRDWDRYMEDIAAANKLICGIDELKDPSFSEESRNSLKAQGAILRAYVMFEMARIWGDFPVITTIAKDITADNIEDVYPSYFPEQNTQKEAFDQIEKDLLYAVQYAPDAVATDKTIYSKSVAKALLAKVYAEKPLQNYAKVIEYADLLEKDGFDLVADFSDLFGMNSEVNDTKVRNTKESILEAHYTFGSGNWVTWMFGKDLVNGDNSFTWAKWITPSRDLINAFDKENDKIRKKESIVYYECNWNNYYPSDNYPFMFKCRSAYSSIIKLRFADILLLKAEAYIMTGNLEEGAKIIDKVRERVKLGKLSDKVRSDKDKMVQALLLERRLELAFEGQRWFDLVRLDKVEEVMNNVYSLDIGRKPQVVIYNKNSYRLPIPQTAIDMNNNLVQNPGY